jgi:hypothetical protein
VKALARIACVLLVGMLAACGGGEGSTSVTSNAPAPQETRLVLDSMSWDQGDWSD